MSDERIVLVVGQDFGQITHWMASKMLEVGDGNYVYKIKERKLHVKGEFEDIVYYSWSKTQDSRNLQGFQGHYPIFLAGEYSSELINRAVYRCARRGLVSGSV